MMGLDEHAGRATGPRQAGYIGCRCSALSWGFERPELFDLLCALVPWHRIV